VNNDLCGCNAVLILNTVVTSNQRDVRLAVLKVIDIKTFEKLKRASSDGLSLSIPGYGDLKGNEDFKSLSEYRNSVFQQESYNLSEQDSLTTIKQFVPDKAIAEWSRCKEICIPATRNGLHAIEEYSDEQIVFASFAWNPPPGAVQDGKVGNSSLIGGAAIEARVPAGQAFLPDQIIPANGQISRSFRREKDQPLRLSVNVNGYSVIFSVLPHVPYPDLILSGKKFDVIFDKLPNPVGTITNSTYEVWYEQAIHT